jgi:hypothetical protein
MAETFDACKIVQTGDGHGASIPIFVDVFVFNARSILSEIRPGTSGNFFDNENWGCDGLRFRSWWISVGGLGASPAAGCRCRHFGTTDVALYTAHRGTILLHNCPSIHKIDWSETRLSACTMRRAHTRLIISTAIFQL